MTYLSLILATAAWGANFNLAKFVVRYSPPFTSAALRFTIAAIVALALYVLTETVEREAIARRLPKYILLGIVGVFGFNVLFFVGLKYTSAVNGSLIMATNPLMTVLLSSFIIGERLRRTQKLGLVLSVLGIFFVVTGGSWAMVQTMSVARGDWFILMGCACWAVYGVLVRKLLPGSSPLATTAITMVPGTLLMVPFALVEPHPVAIALLPAAVWWALLFMAVPGSVMAYLAWNRGMMTLGPAKTSIFFNLVPVFTMLISVASGDHVSTVQVSGGAVVIAGCVLAQTRSS